MPTNKQLKDKFGSKNMITNNQKPDPSKGLVHIQASIHLDGPNAGQVIETPDELLAAEQGITVEQLKDSRDKILARVYSLILSWPDPKFNNDDPAETS